MKEKCGRFAGVGYCKVEIGFMMHEELISFLIAIAKSYQLITPELL